MPTPKVKAAPRTVASFRAEHDKDVIVPNKIRKALEAILAEGPEHHEYETEFVRRASVSIGELAAYRNQFEDHIVEAPHQGKASKRIWFGSAKVARKLRGE